MAKLPPRWPPSGHLGPTTFIRSEKALRSPLPCLFTQDGQDGHPFPPTRGVTPAASAGRKCELSSRIWTTDYWLLAAGCAPLSALVWPRMPAKRMATYGILRKTCTILPEKVGILFTVTSVYALQRSEAAARGQTPVTTTPAGSILCRKTV